MSNRCVPNEDSRSCQYYYANVDSNFADINELSLIAYRDLWDKSSHILKTLHGGSQPSLLPSSLVLFRASRKIESSAGLVIYQHMLANGNKEGLKNVRRLFAHLLTTRDSHPCNGSYFNFSDRFFYYHYIIDSKLNGWRTAANFVRNSFSRLLLLAGCKTLYCYLFGFLWYFVRRLRLQSHLIYTGGYAWIPCLS